LLTRVPWARISSDGLALARQMSDRRLKPAEGSSGVQAAPKPA
jgi:hypothetical protein